MSVSEGPDPVISVENFSKFYGDYQAVREVSLFLRRGEIYGLIGPDGGGKTSLIRSIVTLLHIDGGNIRFLDRSVETSPEFVRKNIGYMPQRFSLYQDLTVEENLRFFADLFEVPKTKALRKIAGLYRFSGLESFKKRRAGALSGGMKQKLALSCMLVHSPGVIVLDEPTFGVDPLSRNEFWQILKQLREEGTSILVSTAYMDEAGHCDRVGLMFNGKILAEDSPEGLVNLYGERLYSVLTGQPHRVLQVLKKSGLCRENTLFGEGPHFTLREGYSLEHLEQYLRERDTPFERVLPIESGIEDLFLKLMKEED